jgi:hypothetical protein
MKKMINTRRFICILIFLGIGSHLSIAQPEVDSVAVGKLGIERMIIEKDNAPSTVGNGFVRYRVFVDMVDYIDKLYGYQLMTGTKYLGKMEIKTTGEWYNNEFGGNIGDGLSQAIFALAPDLEYDSYVTTGGCSNERIGVPYAENPDRYISGTPVSTMLSPGLDLSMFGADNSSDNCVITDGTIYGDPVYSGKGAGGVQGPFASNILMLGQFTTDGDFSFDMNIQIFDSIFTMGRSISDIKYPVSQGNQAPEINITQPANNASFGEGVIVDISANATDSDGTVEKVEFFVDGASVKIDTSSPFSAQWTSVSGAHSITAIATDDLGKTRNSDTVTIAVDGNYVIELSKNSAIKICPNPFNKGFYIELNNPLNDQKYHYYVYDISGIKVYEGYLDVLSNGREYIKMDDFKPGIYFVKINTGNKIIQKKLIKE